LQASKRKLPGHAFLEAMARCVIPVLTDSPAFRAMAERLEVVY
jgi:hypothetical protein